MTKYVVATVDEIPPGHRKVVEVAKRSVGVFNVKGNFYAIRNQCPHGGGPMCEGVTSGLVRSDKPGNYDYIMRGEIIRCPWHGWEFEIATGRSIFNPHRTRVRSYQVSVSGSAAEHESVETYPVSVEDGFVLLHTEP